MISTYVAIATLFFIVTFSEFQTFLQWHSSEGWKFCEFYFPPNFTSHLSHSFIDWSLHNIRHRWDEFQTERMANIRCTLFLCSIVPLAYKIFAAQTAPGMCRLPNEQIRMKKVFSVFHFSISPGRIWLDLFHFFFLFFLTEFSVSTLCGFWVFVLLLNCVGRSSKVRFEFEVDKIYSSVAIAEIYVGFNFLFVGSTIDRLKMAIFDYFFSSVAKQLGSANIWGSRSTSRQNEEMMWRRKFPPFSVIWWCR